MLRKIDHETMGRSDHDWLASIHHFSFASYRDPDNVRFGVLRVLNDDIVQPHTGFDTHPHRDMEIMSYVVDGDLTHGDSMNNKKTVTRGQLQYMSAGKGVYHSEYNHGDEPLRFLQLWVFPDKQGHIPQYGDHAFPWEDRVNQWLHMVSPIDGDAPIRIHQDVNLFVIDLEDGRSIDFDVASDRQAYLIQIEGQSIVNGIKLMTRDALAVVGEPITLTAVSGHAHVLAVEMKQDK